jgi:tetratricopeptide (TPR) repeat protein
MPAATPAAAPGGSMASAGTTPHDPAGAAANTAPGTAAAGAPSSLVPSTAAPAAATAPAPSATAGVAQQTGAPVGAAPAAPADSAAGELANEYVQRASALYDDGKIEQALAEYRRGISHDPMDSDTWYGLAETFHALGREKQALDTYALALTMIVHAPELRAPYAELLLANKKRDEAIKVLQRGIELDPDNSETLKAMLGTTALLSLDDSSAAPAASVKSELKALPAKPAPPGAKKAAPVKRKKLCKLFCSVAKPK